MKILQLISNTYFFNCSLHLQMSGFYYALSDFFCLEYIERTIVLTYISIKYRSDDFLTNHLSTRNNMQTDFPTFL